MPSWLPPALSLEAAAFAAFFAELGHRRLPDREIARTCGRVALCLLLAGLGFLLIAQAARPAADRRDEAARAMRTAPVSLHAPSSLQALARDLEHRPFDLLARDDR